MTTRTVITTLALTSLLAACTGSDDTGDTDDTMDTADTADTADTQDTDVTESARVRVIHASPDAPTVDVWAVGVDEPLIEDLAYGDVTGYLELPAATYTIELRAAGSAGTVAAAYSQSLTVPETGDVTVIAAGLLAGSGDEAFRLLALAEDFTTPAADTARVRIVHASPTAPAVALDVGNDGTPEVASLARYADTGVAGVELPSDTAIQIGIWTTGTDAARVTAFTTPELPEGGELFVIATGLLGDLPREETGFSLLAVAPTGAVGFIKQNPRVFALHASPDAPAVDIFAGASELVDDLAFNELSSAIQVPPGAYTLDFFATAVGATRPSGDAAASATTPSLAAGESYLAIASGFLGATGDDEPFQLLPFAEGFDVTEAGALVRAVHASPGAPSVDIGTVATNVLTPVAAWTNVPFGAASGAAGVALAADTYDLGIAPTGDTTPLFNFPGVALAGGDRFFAVATGEVADGFGLVLIDASTTAWTATPVAPATIAIAVE